MKRSSTTGSGGSRYLGNGDNIYKVIKLKTGEIVMCELDSDITDFAFSPTITLINPVLIITISMQLENSGLKQEEIAMKPFLMLSDSESFPLSTDTIITMGNMKPAAVRLYKAYVKGVTETREEEARDEAIIELLKSVAPGRPLLFIEHETPMFVERNELPDEVK